MIFSCCAAVRKCSFSEGSLAESSSEGQGPTIPSPLPPVPGATVPGPHHRNVPCVRHFGRIQPSDLNPSPAHMQDTLSRTSRTAAPGQPARQLPVGRRRTARVPRLCLRPWRGRECGKAPVLHTERAPSSRASQSAPPIMVLVRSASMSLIGEIGGTSALPDHPRTAYARPTPPEAPVISSAGLTRTMAAGSIRINHRW